MHASSLGTRKASELQNRRSFGNQSLTAWSTPDFTVNICHLSMPRVPYWQELFAGSMAPWQRKREPKGLSGRSMRDEWSRGKTDHSNWLGKFSWEIHSLRQCSCLPKIIVSQGSVVIEWAEKWERQQDGVVKSVHTGLPGSNPGLPLASWSVVVQHFLPFTVTFRVQNNDSAHFRGYLEK